MYSVFSKYVLCSFEYVIVFMSIYCRQNICYRTYSSIVAKLITARRLGNYIRLYFYK
jgi:hypothetical protein